MLVPNPKGNYAFLQGIAPYSGGAVAERGYEVVHARFAQPVPLNEGFERVKKHLIAVKRPAQALCGMELRSPKPFTFEGFNSFNAGYIQVLKDWNIFLDGVNPVARTNIAPEIGAPPVPSLYGFSYTTPSARRERTFIVAGAGELPEGSLKPEDVVRRGETSNEALREKTRFVMGLMTGRLQGLGVDWQQVTVTEVYTVHSICSFLAAEIIRPMGRAGIHGMTWHYSRPPIVTIEYEMDVRGCHREIVL
ncbi:MAG: RidA family protein [Acidobacteria bacterium]|nr:RidA family protein [Acidobacteriota bacterium]